jgi:hypothetical protein
MPCREHNYKLLARYAMPFEVACEAVDMFINSL